jgi:hypothetical protein
MYRSVVPAIVADVAPATLISVGGVATSFDTGIPACPAGHARDTHAVKELDPAADNVPAGHDTHATDEFAPLTTEYVPAVQLIHTALPALVLYFPATQATHGPPSGPVDPALQPADTQELILELPAADVVPTGHATQPVAAHAVPVRSTP